MDSNFSKSDGLVRASIHEAGHLVMATLLGVKAKAKLASYNYGGPRNNRVFGCTKIVRCAAIKKPLIGLAGAIAELMITSYPKISDDELFLQIHDAMKYGAMSKNDRDMIGNNMEQSFSEALQLVANNLDEIKSEAHKLVLQYRIDYET